MARTIDLNCVVTQFETMVLQELQNKEALFGTVREYDSVGEIFQIPKFGPLDLQPHDFSAGNLPVSDLSTDKIQVTPMPSVLKSVIGTNYQTLFNFDLVSGYARQHANAIGRYLDSKKIDLVTEQDAIFTAGNNNLVDLSTETGADQYFSVNALVRAKAKLIENGADCSPDSLSLWMPARNLPSFMADARFTSWDYNSDRPLENGRVTPGFMGVSFREIGSASTVGSIPLVGGFNSVYLVSKDAIAMAFNKRPFSMVVKNDSELRTEVISDAVCGAGIAFEKAIVKINAKAD